MELNQLSTNPFEKIAMGMSGGGYRAGAFHLGALSYLHRLQYNGAPLLSHLKMISTVSGGSITGIVYAIKKQEGKSFEEFYQFLLTKLETVDLVEEGIKKLNPDAVWNTTTKRKNLINAFSELYDKHFTGGRTLGFLQSETGFETFVFNSTEFTNALNFRFKNTGAGNSGNFYIRPKKSQLEEIKLSDIMASSSCFPGGFEPMIWPYDFAHQQSVEIDKLCKNNPPPVGIMDGGIYDNQGIESILNYKKGDEKPYFDLIIVSDVTSPYMTAYKPFKEGEKKGINRYTVKDIEKKVKGMNRILTLSLTLSLVALVCLPFVWRYSLNLGTGLSLGFAFAILLLLIIKFFIAGRVRGLINDAKEKIKNAIPAFYYERLSFLQTDELSLHRLEPLLMDRINSLVTLLTSVFLKVVRRLTYRQLYTNDLYEFRRASNLVQELTRKDFKLKQADPPNHDTICPERRRASVLLGDYDTVIGKNISPIAEQASSFGTTLWFTEKDHLGKMLETLVCSGQFTLCYNLLDYLERIIYEPRSGYTELPENIQLSIFDTYERCKSDWAAFKNDPKFMIK